MPFHSKWQYLPTEAINPDTLEIDRMPTLEVIDLFVAEDRKVVTAVQRERVHIANGVEIIANALKKGGRLFLVGAGTSGRLGILEAAEMPPTFGTAPGLVQAIMAGGQDAVFRTREGVEDNFEEGARSVARLRISKRDVIIGVSASRHYPVRAGGADGRPQEERAHHLRHLLARQRAAELRGPADCPGRRARSDCRLDEAEGRRRRPRWC